MQDFVRFCRGMAALVLAMLVGMPAYAGSYLVRLGSTDFTMTVDDTYCQLDETQTFDRNFADFQRKSNQGHNHYVDGFLVCHELESLRGGQPVNLSRWVIILSPIQAGDTSIQPVRGFQPENFLDEMEKQFRKGVKVDSQAVTASVNRAAAEVRGKPVTNPIEITADGQPYFLHRSDQAVFAGIKMQVGAGDTSHQVGGVFAMTLVDNHMASIYVFSTFDWPDTINRLLGETSMIMRSVPKNK